MPNWKKNVKQKFPFTIQIKYNRFLIIWNTMRLNASSIIEFGSDFIYPIIILSEANTWKIVSDAGHLSDKTEVTKYHFLLLPVQVLILAINGKNFSTTVLSTGYHQVARTPEKQKLVHFVVGKDYYKHKRGFYGLKALPVFFNQNVTILSAPIRRNEVLTYYDDASVQVEDEPQVLEQIRIFHQALRNSKFKVVPV